MRHKVDGEFVDERTYHGLLEIFDRVAKHMLKQARRSMAHAATGGLRCAYRLIDGRTCAVGCLIAPEHYRDALELKNATDPLVTSTVAISLGRKLTREDLRLLQALQTVHDVDLSVWGDDSGIPAWSIIGPLNRVAARFGLPLLPPAPNTPKVCACP
jgi:hypothetical protein